MHPLFQPKGCLIASCTRKDLYFEPFHIPLAYANAAERLDATMMPLTTVQDIVIEDFTVQRVVTSRGDLITSKVVDAAGAWLSNVSMLAGSPVPTIPMLHQIMITEPLEAIRTSQPITRIIDANVAMRPYNGGLMLGGYEKSPRNYRLGSLSDSFQINDLELDLKVLRNWPTPSRSNSRFSRQPPFRSTGAGCPP